MIDTNFDASKVVEKATTSELPPLPFTYQVTEDQSEAKYRQWRVSPIVFDYSDLVPATNEELVERVRKEHENKQWYTIEHWRLKGEPVEQVDFMVGDKTITLYSWMKDKKLSDDQLSKMGTTLSELSSKFPKVLDQINWILVEDVQPPSVLGDDELYPTNGTAMSEHHAFRYMPRGLETFPHRVKKTSNLEGTLVHELGHLIQKDFEEEWRQNYQWQFCYDHESDWEIRELPNGEKKWFNKESGEMSPQGQFAIQPEQCVTGYAKQNMGEDICDSLVAYIFDPDLLRSVAPQKYDILNRHDVKSDQPQIQISRRLKEEISLPQIQPETVLFYIEEPED